MKITITGSLGHISKPLTEILVKAGHTVTVVSSSADRAEEIKALGAIPAIGLITDVAFLTNAFKGADVVYTMVPPYLAAPNWKDYIAGIGNNYAAAIKVSGVTKVVNLSSIGAHLEDGTGPITGSYRTEQALNALAGVIVKHLRPASFYTNFYSNAGMIKNAGIIGANYGADTTLVLVHPTDIAEAAAEELQSAFSANSIRYITSDERKAGDVAAILGAAIGKPNLPWIEFTDADSIAGAIQAGLSEEVAKNFTEMGAAIRSGIVYEDYLKHKPVLSKRKLEEFAIEFAKAF